MMSCISTLYMLATGILHAGKNNSFAAFTVPVAEIHTYHVAQNHPLITFLGRRCTEGGVSNEHSREQSDN